MPIISDFPGAAPAPQPQSPMPHGVCYLNPRIQAFSNGAVLHVLQASFGLDDEGAFLGVWVETPDLTDRDERIKQQRLSIESLIRQRDEAVARANATQRLLDEAAAEAERLNKIVSQCNPIVTVTDEMVDAALREDAGVSLVYLQAMRVAPWARDRMRAILTAALNAR